MLVYNIRIPKLDPKLNLNYITIFLYNLILIKKVCFFIHKYFIEKICLKIAILFLLKQILTCKLIDYIPYILHPRLSYVKYVNTILCFAK